MQYTQIESSQDSANIGEIPFDESTSWRLLETNCEMNPRLPIHRLCGEHFQSAPASELFHFSVISGDKLLVAHEVAPVYVINELDPSLSIRSNRSGITMSVRVTLPHSIDPDSPRDGPLTLMIKGPTYRDVDRWKRLSFSQTQTKITELLQQRLAFLRTKYGRQVSLRDAYVDQIVLDLVAGLGETKVWIDDVNIAGEVAVPKRLQSTKPLQEFDSNVVPANFESNMEFQRRPDLKIDGTVIEVDGRPFAARVVQHNGEPLEFLAQLGFNVVSLKSVPSTQQQLAARQLGVWLIAPPPENVGLSPISQPFDRVLAWSLGQNLGLEDLPRTQALVREIRQSDPWKERPLLAEVDAGWEEYSRIADIAVNGFEPLGGSFLLNDYSSWLRQRSDLAGRAMPAWAVMQTEYPPEIINQAAAIAGRVPPLAIEPFQIQSMLYETIASGARGHWFRSNNRLDATDPQTRLRVLTIRWINAQIQQMEPWIAGGAVIRSLDSTQRDAEVTTIKTSRSRLLLVQRPTYLEQWVAGTPQPTTILINNPSASSADQIYRITETTLLPLDRGRQLNTTEIKIDDCPANAAIVMTQEPLIIRSLMEATSRPGSESILQLHVELTRSWLVMSQIVSEQLQRTGNGLAEVNGANNEATNLMQQVIGLVETGSITSAVPYLLRADQRLASARQAIIMRGRRSFANGTACPLFASMTTMPSYWDLAERLTGAEWQPNGLPGGEFEDLSQLTNAGWENYRSDLHTIETLVELSSEAARLGSSGLILQATGSNSIVDGDPLWIKSAKVKVKAGQFVCIHGWVNVPQAVQGNLNGLMIYDSIGGRELGERFTVTRGWQEFSLYRGISDDTDLQVTFALTGFGKVMLDEVTIRAVTPQPVSLTNSNPDTSTNPQRQAARPEDN